jgi:hypothetical protein
MVYGQNCKTNRATMVDENYRDSKYNRTSIFSRCIIEYEGAGITVLDSKYFEPCSGYDLECKPEADSFVNHQHDGSWVPAWFRVIGEAVYRWEIYFLAAIIILIVLFFTVSPNIIGTFSRSMWRTGVE